MPLHTHKEADTLLDLFPGCVVRKSLNRLYCYFLHELALQEILNLHVGELELSKNALAVGGIEALLSHLHWS